MLLTDETLITLHNRLLNQSDPTAVAEAFDPLQNMLLEYLHRTFPRQVIQDCEDIVVSVLASYFENPAQFNPAKARLDAYLRMAAHGDMMNLVQKQKRLDIKTPYNLDELDENGVADQILARNTDQDESVEDVALSNALTQPRLEAVLSRLDATEQAIVHLIIEGERETARYAEVLGITQQPIMEQRQTVKRIKDRLTKWLKRQFTPGEF